MQAIFEYDPRQLWETVALKTCSQPRSFNKSVKTSLHSHRSSLGFVKLFCSEKKGLCVHILVLSLLLPSQAGCEFSWELILCRNNGWDARQTRPAVSPAKNRGRKLWAPEWSTVIYSTTVLCTGHREGPHAHILSLHVPQSFMWKTIRDHYLTLQFIHCPGMLFFAKSKHWNYI